jgi:hypothetical protein
MKKSLVRNLVLLVIVTAFFASCQRGYGCPNKFEVKSELKK